ncbi:hypothetical protein J2W34_002326 [Variovorax boronicumulans]|uniref:SUKH-4 family immunity protein n=1 Tax=Variovorax boronicumulans TaxID=436515 RepID=UPI0027890BE9|nr:SUKH-4 family immunity protein [Variovorax boronicumulans]MDQ0070541.1 hypothetical protein [Variovorax boronicumulans]
MTPIEFRQQFISNALANPGIEQIPELKEQLSKFVQFDRETLVVRGIDQSAADFLAEGGLPQDAAPYLNFNAYSEQELKDLYDLYEMPKEIFPIGANGSGDPLGIEISSQAIVFLNHDANMQRVFINSSIQQFAQSLLCYQQLLKQGQGHELLERLQSIDPVATKAGSMWHAEARSNPYRV